MYNTDLNSQQVPAANMSASPAVSRQLSDLIDDLKETEVTYITRIESILADYCDKMDDKIYKKLMPWSLTGQKKRIFGNLREILDFHKSLILPYLRSYKNAYQLGSKFVFWGPVIRQLYQRYYINVGRAKNIIAKVEPDNTFFEKCRRNSNLKENITDLLNIILRRLPVYEYILTEMIEITQNTPEKADITQNTPEKADITQNTPEKAEITQNTPEKAEITQNTRKKAQELEELTKGRDIVSTIRKQCNVVTLIKGYKTDDFIEAGLLITHGPFKVFIGKLSSADVKLKKRHLFLFDNILLVCNWLPKKESFKYYDVVKLRPKNRILSVIPDIQHAFWLYDDTKYEAYKIEAPTADVWRDWVKDLKMVLSR